MLIIRLFPDPAFRLKLLPTSLDMETKAVNPHHLPARTPEGHAAYKATMEHCHFFTWASKDSAMTTEDAVIQFIAFRILPDVSLDMSPRDMSPREDRRQSHLRSRIPGIGRGGCRLQPHAITYKPT